MIKYFMYILIYMHGAREMEMIYIIYMYIHMYNI
jgi:hypothetical protein